MVVRQNLYEMSPVIYDRYVSTKIEAENFSEVLKHVKSFCKGKKYVKILDMCCGTGIFLRKWLSRLDISFSYTGVDINKHFLKYAIENSKMKTSEFILHDASTVKLNDKFDIVIATSAYHHIKDVTKREFLLNIRSHMESEGILIVYEKAIAPFKNPSEAARSGTEFYAKRIPEMMKNEKLDSHQIFGLYNEIYLSSIRLDEYKVSYQRIVKDLASVGLKIIRTTKLWPKDNRFSNSKVGDFVFLVQKV
ncbi:MAG: class I SAM-dependent methyltransferase [Candidatus Aenigmatarchaeota archaeon]